jgi:hypothetical protein
MPNGGWLQMRPAVGLSRQTPHAEGCNSSIRRIKARSSAPVHSRSRWLGINDLIAEPEGPSFISGTVARRRVDRRCS